MRNLVPGAEEAKAAVSNIYLKTLREYARSAALLGVRNVVPILSTASHVGAVIIQAAEEKNVPTSTVHSSLLYRSSTLLFMTFESEFD